MHLSHKTIILSGIPIVCAAAIAALFLFRAVRPAIEAPVAQTIVPAAPLVAEKPALPKGWLETFTPSSVTEKDALPKGWVLEHKPGTKSAVFSVGSSTEGTTSFLRMEADKASASVITRLDNVDLKKTPILRWRWRATTLPAGADGRSKATDDQAIGIYVGSGSTMNNKSVSYRWDTETPVGAEGNIAYGFGTIKVKWFTLRNKEDAKDGQWIVEERNVAEDFEKAWGYIPDEIYLSVSCNSQYTGSEAAAELNWIGLDAVSANNNNGH